MSKHNYTNYSKPQVAEETVEKVTVEEEVVIETPVEEAEMEEAVVEIPATFAKVVDCKKLRVRKNPHKLADVLCEIPVGSEVKIDLDNSTVGFYKVCTEAGVEGYCVKEFIAIV